MTEITRIVERLRAEFVALSDATWHDPELRWNETRAVERQIAIAERHGFHVERAVAGIPTAFTATRGSGGSTIAVLGEYDALARLGQESGAATLSPLPGAGHGCGHNLLGAGSLLAAVAAAEYLVAAGVPGTVRYFGCPAEEAAAGKTYLVRDGAFDGVDAAITWHPATVLSARQFLTLAATQVHFDFSGTAAHAGAAPHLGRSALDAVELLNVGVNFLREHMPDSARVHYAITDAGGDSPNVVQSAASVYYIVRSATVAEMRELYARVVKIAQGAALMTETALTVRFDGASAEILPNDTLEELLARVVETAGPVPFTDRHSADAAPFAPADAPALLAAPLPFDPRGARVQTTASTDVGDVSWVVPTAQVMTPTAANGTPIHSWQMVAQGAMPHAHEAMAHAARVMATAVVELAESPELVERARAEHAAAVALRPYENPIPADAVAPPLQAPGA